MAVFRTLINTIVLALLASSTLAAPSLLANHAPGTVLEPHNSKSGIVVTALVDPLAKTSAHVVALTSATVTANVQANVFLGLFRKCNDLAATLSVNLNGLISQRTGFAADSVVQILASIVAEIDLSIQTLQNVAVCTDATVAATAYKAFGVLVAAQVKVLALITANPALWVRLNLQVSLRAALINLQRSLNTYVNLLFAHISADLDILNLRVSLFASIQAAIDSCN